MGADGQRPIEKPALPLISPSPSPRWASTVELRGAGAVPGSACVPARSKNRTSQSPHRTRTTANVPLARLGPCHDPSQQGATKRVRSSESTCVGKGPHRHGAARLPERGQQQLISSSRPLLVPQTQLD